MTRKLIKRCNKFIITARVHASITGKLTYKIIISVLFTFRARQNINTFKITITNVTAYQTNLFVLCVSYKARFIKLEPTHKLSLDGLSNLNNTNIQLCNR